MRSKLTGPEEQRGVLPGALQCRQARAQRLVLMIESFESYLDTRNASQQCQQPNSFFFQLLWVGRGEALTNAFRDVQKLAALLPV